MSTSTTASTSGTSSSASTTAGPQNPVGKTFVNRTDATSELQRDYGTRLGKTIQVNRTKSGSANATLECPSANCAFLIKMNRETKGLMLWRVTQFENHSLTCTATTTWSTARAMESNSFVGLVRNEAPFKAARSTAAMELNVQLKPHQLARARSKARRITREAFDASYPSLIPRLLKILEENPGSYAKVGAFVDDVDLIEMIMTSDEAGVVAFSGNEVEEFAMAHFHFFFLALGPVIRSAPAMLPFYGADACHCTSMADDMRIYVLEGRYGDGSLVPMATFMVNRNEDNFSWKTFLTCCSACGYEPYINNERAALITDLRAGVDNVVSTIFPRTNHRLCAMHVRQLVRKKFGEAHVALVFRLQRPVTALEYSAVANEIQNTVPNEVWEYLVSTKPEKWTNMSAMQAKINSCGLSVDMSEVENARMKRIGLREEAPADVALSIVRIAAGVFKLGRDSVSARDPDDILGTKGFTFLAQALDGAKTCAAVYPQGELQSIVFCGQKEYAVDIERWTCTCGIPQLYGVPCAHWVATARRSSRFMKNPHTFHDAFYTTCFASFHLLSTLREAFAPVIRVPDKDQILPSDDTLLPPKSAAASRRAGRPRKKRFPSAGEAPTGGLRGRGATPRGATDNADEDDDDDDYDNEENEEEEDEEATAFALAATFPTPTQEVNGSGP